MSYSTKRKSKSLLTRPMLLLFNFWYTYFYKVAQTDKYSRLRIIHARLYRITTHQQTQALSSFVTNTSTQKITCLSKITPAFPKTKDHDLLHQTLRRTNDSRIDCCSDSKLPLGTETYFRWRRRGL